MTVDDDPAAPLRMLMGREISAVCFVRDYVELHFDGPVLRALANPFGMYGNDGWRFPEGQSPILLRYYIGKTIDDCELIPASHLAIASGEHSFAVPLDDTRSGPEAAHLVGVDEHGQTDPRTFCAW